MQLRFGNHGWLTPAALGCTVFDRRGNDGFSEMRTHVHRSGDRQPAVGVSVAGAVAFLSHGWLTPAALGCTVFDRRGNDGFSEMRTHVQGSDDRQPAVAQNRIGNRNRPRARGDRLLHKSGGRQPPVGSGTALTASGEGCRMAAAERGPRRLVGGGLSVVYRELTCSCVSGTTAGLRQPLLLHDVRSPGNRVFQSGVAHAPRAGGVSPPWFNQRRCKRESFPWSAHADRSWRTTLRPAGE
jgi:hypothetical protein